MNPKKRYRSGEHETRPSDKQRALTCACRDQSQWRKNAGCNPGRESPTPPHWTGLLEIGTLTATLNCKFKVVAVERNIPIKFQYLVEDGCSFPAFGIWQVHTYFPPGTFTPCSSSACRWVEALLPPKLQRRGLVFKGKMVTVERVWRVTTIVREGLLICVYEWVTLVYGSY